MTEIIPMPEGFEFHNACNEPCDMVAGFPCACGAWHKLENWPKEVLIAVLNEKIKKEQELEEVFVKLKDFIKSQQDTPPEIASVIQKEFWNLV